MIDQKRAMEILLAFACCGVCNGCDRCPWNNTIDCEETAFDDVLNEAIDVVRKLTLD